MRQVYYTATAQVKDGPRHVFVVHPNGNLKEDDRTPDEIMAAAAAKGHDTSYCALYTFNVGQYTSDQIRGKIINWLRYRYADIRNDWEIEVDVVNKIIVR